MWFSRVICYGFVLVVGLALSGDNNRARLYSQDSGPSATNATYDYVVVGGGTAGITIASRLAEDSMVSVAVIEAGGFYEVDNGNYSIVPGLALSAPFLTTAESYPPQPLIDWGLVSTPQPGAGNRRIHYAQGKTLAGSSALNVMAYHRATNGTYQRWAELVGDDSYSFSSLLPFFERSCQLTPPNESKRHISNASVPYDSTVFSRSGGPLQVSWSNWVDPVLTWFQRAFASIDLPISPKNFNSGSLSGFSAWIPSTISPFRAVRSSSQTAFLTEAMNKTGLVVYTHALAKRILFRSEESASCATGVSVTTQDAAFTISARKEVILSAGVFHSPQLLMVSGIGPRTTLEQHGIPVISDLPGVGQQLWDQILFSVSSKVDIPTAAQLINESQSMSYVIQEYLDNAEGPLSSFNGLIAFEKIPLHLREHFTATALSRLEEFPSDWPEVEYVSASGMGPDGSGIGIISGALSASFSQGNVTISSADSADPPVINLGWLSDSDDVDVQLAVAAIKRIRQAFSKISEIAIGPELTPGPHIQTDADILAFVRNTTSTTWHAAATCAMGKIGDVGAVVDSGARVIGVKGLRVVDNSAVPFAVPGHPQATVYMLAEKIADLIRSGWA